MFIKRTALIASIATVGVVASGNVATASAADGHASQAGPAGLTYGASTAGFEREAWLRLGPKRQAVASVWIDFTAPASRCTGGEKGYFGSFLSGYEWDEYIAVRKNGSFEGRVDDTMRFEGGRRARERVTLSGTVTRRSVTASVVGVIDLTGGGKPNARCTFGPQKWLLLD
jgi:hypothetical protein